MKGAFYGWVLAVVLVACAGSRLGFPEEITVLPEPRPQAVFVRGSEGYHTYRIPSLLVTPKGTLLAFCEGRRCGRGDSGDIDLLLKRSTDGGRTWSGQVVIWDDGGNTCGNPCPVVDRETGRIWLFMTWNLGKDRETEIIHHTSKDTRRAFVCYSDDDGLADPHPTVLFPPAVICQFDNSDLTRSIDGCRPMTDENLRISQLADDLLWCIPLPGHDPCPFRFKPKS